MMRILGPMALIAHLLMIPVYLVLFGAVCKIVSIPFMAGWRLL